MNDQQTHYELSGDIVTNPMNLVLIRMQIQAFTESLRRLEKQSNVSPLDLTENEPINSQPRPNC